MFFSKTWDEVPAGSTLHVKFTTSGPFVFGGEHVVDRGPTAPVLVGRLPSGLSEFEIRMNQNENHIFKFDAGFAGQACTFELTAKVTTGGSTHQQAFSAKHTLKNSGDMLTVKLAAVGEA
ncbi:MAG TPA: hypothetical protein VFS20_09155 [Longimicrobium sp.]|nr:hypothetical protein [Longimicrobium sp.]